MQLNTVNSTVITQPLSTDAGAPILTANPFPPVNVTPTFNLPKDGQRPEDKNPKNKNPYSGEINEVGAVEDVLPESFKLILSPDFHEIFKAFFDNANSKISMAQRLFRLSNGMREHKVYSVMYQKMPDSLVKREKALEQVLLYHYNRPGTRFLGQI